jgi:hypothetical protein
MTSSNTAVALVLLAARRGDPGLCEISPGYGWGFQAANVSPSGDAIRLHGLPGDGVNVRFLSLPAQSTRSLLSTLPNTGRFNTWIPITPRFRLVAMRASQFFGVKREKSWTGREFISPDFLR